MTPDELAREFTRAIVASGTSEGHIRVFVRGGTGDPGEFDAAFLAALLAEMPSIQRARVEIVHPAVVRVCSDCGHFFESAEPDATCPQVWRRRVPGVARRAHRVRVLLNEPHRRRTLGGSPLVSVTNWGPTLCTGV